MYFGHSKCHCDLKGTMMEGMVPGRNGRGRPAWRCALNTDTLGVEVHRGISNNSKLLDRPQWEHHYTEYLLHNE